MQNTSARNKIYRLEDISAEGKARLMDMAYSRLRFGFATMPIISAIFAWYYQHLDKDVDNRVIMWSAIYFIWFGLSLLMFKAYQNDQKTISATAMLNTWLPRMHKIVIIHGLGIAALLPLVNHTATTDFKLLYMLTMCAIVAANATHQSPMISMFHRFFASVWHVSVLLIPWTFNTNWQFVLPLAIIYSFAMHYYSLKSHRFFVQLIWLEEEGARLAERYKSAKEEAESALLAKNQFLTTASHDLRQPIHAMGFLIESISQRNEQPSLAPALTDLKQSVRSITQMFNSLLDLSKIETGTIKLRPEAISLQQLIQDIVTVFREEARSRQLDLRIRNKYPNATAIADTLLLRQAVVNLMQNALRYTQHGGVLIGVRKRSDHWQIEIWDTGIGVTLADQDKIYSPFFRNEHAWHLDSAGHGLGLAVVARCSELMGATHGFTSREGRGSKFWLRLPAIVNTTPNFDDALNSDKKPTTQPDIRLPSLSGTCLIVDDDPQVCKAWEALLSSWGIEVKCANSSTEAFSLLDEGFNPQAILCDQRLRAGESGFEILEALLERYPNAHGAMISGEFNSPELVKAENEGYLVLHKPLEPEMLHAILSRWL